MIAQTPQQDIMFESQGEVYSISIKSTLNCVTILICKDNKIPRKRFESQFSLEALTQKSKWFLLFDSIQTIAAELQALAQEKKFKLIEDGNTIHLSFLFKIWNIEDITLDLPQCEIKSSDVIQDICQSINQMKTSLSSLIEDFDYLKENPEFIKIYNRGKYFKTHHMKLITPDFLNVIKTQITDKAIEFKLIYASSIDEGTSEAFHKLCDNQGRTLVVIQTIKNIVFGGFTNVSWDKSEQYKSDANAFLFSNTLEIIYPVSNKAKAIYCSPNHGPFFGSTDINTNAHFSINSNSALFSSYSEGIGSEINGNREKFIVQELEVYKVLIS